jgi:hypothetical protein
LQEFYFITTRILEGHIPKGKEMVRTEQEQGKIGRCHRSALAWIMHYMGDTKWKHAMLMRISLYTEREMRQLWLIK